MHHSPGVDRSEGTLEVHGGTEGSCLKRGEPALQGTLQDALVSESSHTPCRGSAGVAPAADFKPAGLGLAQALHGKAESFVLDFSFNDTAHYVTFRGPNVQQALAALP